MLVAFLLANPALALMSSTNYRVWSDSVSQGGNRSSSAGYIIEDTIGEAGTGENSSSANYLIDAGLPAIFEEPVLRLTLSDSSFSLSSLSSTAVRTASYTVGVSTNADSGYTLQVLEDGNLRSGASSITDVSDGTVTVGSLEYGISASGTDAVLVGDNAITTTPLTVASSASRTTGTTTTVTHKASVAGGEPSGTYSHTVTYIAVANF